MHLASSFDIVIRHRHSTSSLDIVIRHNVWQLRPPRGESGKSHAFEFRMSHYKVDCQSFEVLFDRPSVRRILMIAGLNHLTIDNGIYSTKHNVFQAGICLYGINVEYVRPSVRSSFSFMNLPMSNCKSSFKKMTPCPRRTDGQMISFDIVIQHRHWKYLATSSDAAGKWGRIRKISILF